MSVLLSVRPYGTTRLQLDGLSWNFIVQYFRKSFEKLSFINIWQDQRVLHMKTNLHFWSYLAQFFLEWEMFLTKVVDKSKHTFYDQKLFSPKIVPLWDNVEMYYTAGQGTGDNMAHSHCILGTWGYQHILRTCNTSCFSTAKMVARTCASVTLHVHWLSC